MSLKKSKKYSKPYTAQFAAAVMCFFCFSLFSPAVCSQEFSAIDTDLAQLENLINDTIANSEQQQKLLEDLRQSLNESGNLIKSYEQIMIEREKLLQDLQAQLTAMSETYRKQSALSAKYAQNSKFWRTFTLIGIPATAVISGVVVFAAVR
jgi:septal ring factor EnvC (AmiA/AmiB activator)